MAHENEWQQLVRNPRHTISHTRVGQKINRQFAHVRPEKIPTENMVWSTNTQKNTLHPVRPTIFLAKIRFKGKRTIIKWHKMAHYSNGKAFSNQWNKFTIQAVLCISVPKKPTHRPVSLSERRPIDSETLGHNCDIKTLDFE